MTYLSTRASVRWTALSLLAAVVVAGSPAIATPAVAASQPQSPQTAGQTTAVSGGPRLIDLGSLKGGARAGRRTGFLNNRGQLATAITDTVSGTDKAVLLSEGSVTDIHASLGLGTGSSSFAWDVNSQGTVIGFYNEEAVPGETAKPAQAFAFKDGVATKLGLPPAVAINDVNRVVGNNYVYDLDDGSMLRIDKGLKPRSVSASSLNNRGEVVGTFVDDSDPDDARAVAFRIRKWGVPLNPVTDRLRFSAGSDAMARDINDRGQVAGVGMDGTNHVPLIWNEDGMPIEMRTPGNLGGDVLAINNAGMGAGVVNHLLPDGVRVDEHAALYVNGGAVDLNTLLPADTPFTLVYATGINDAGQIGGFMEPKNGGRFHAFVLDLGGGLPEIESVALKTRLYPSEAWVPIPEDGTVDGNEVQVTVQVTNPSDYPTYGWLRLREDRAETWLRDGGFLLSLAPHQTVTKRVVWDTAGFAWQGGKARSDRRLEANLFIGGWGELTPVSTGAVSVTVRPKPVVLVHGYLSNAAKTWGDYATILASAHPLLRGYPADKLKTGNKSKPAERTYTEEENAQQLDIYIEGVRQKTHAFQVDVVAHDSGGVITRRYIQYMMPSTVAGKPVVNRMLQMGTPNRGTPCADALLAGAAMGVPIPMPATLHSTVKFMEGTFNLVVTNLKGVTASSLAGVGKAVCDMPDAGDGDGQVTVRSAHFVYTDAVTTRTGHNDMPGSAADFLSYVKPRLASLLVGNDSPDGLPYLKDNGARERGDAPKSGAESGAAVAAVDGADSDSDAGAGIDGISSFATASVTAKPGATASVPLDVPAGSAFGVTGALPETVGLLLRDPSGKEAASYAAGSDAAKQPIQGLSVTKPQAGVWKLEVTNTGSEPVTADVVAWITGNAVKVTSKVEQPSDDGRVKMTATVTDDGQPVTGAPVKAILIGEQDTPHVELILNDDGNSGDGAAGDGLYGATTEPLADGAYAAVVRADTAKGMRTAHDVVKVAKPDLREFELTVSAQPGGSVAASPAQDTYRVGTTVTLTVTADVGRIPLGWTVDGEERPGGSLTITMDGPHTVVARFGSYTVTELGALPGGDPGDTKAARLNDRGQVAATGKDKDHKSRAVRWEAGAFTDLGDLPCTDGPGRLACAVGATGINEAGNVSGWASTTVEDGAGGYVNLQHAVVFRDGAVTDLQPADSPRLTSSLAIDLNDDDQIFGSMYAGYSAYPYVMWDHGAVIRLPEEPDFDARTDSGHINRGGEVAGSWVTSRNAAGPTGWNPAVYRDGEIQKLKLPDCDGAGSGFARDINATGVLAGYGYCNTGEKVTFSAYTWRDGRRTDLGTGTATAINDHGLVAGFAGEPVAAVPAVWLDGQMYKLADLLPRPMCPQDIDDTIEPCMRLNVLLDVNSPGQILAQGVVRDRSATSAGFTESARSFLLTPTTAQADLKVEQSVSAAEPGPGGTVTWTTTVTNTGPDTATDVRLDVLIPGVLAGTAVCETWRGKCAPLQGGFRNTVAKLEPGWDATVEVTATIPAGMAEGTELKATAGAASLAVGDPKPASNVASTTATVRPLLDKTGITWADPVQVGSTSSAHTVTLTNRLNEPIPLKDITVEGPFTQTDDCPPAELAVDAACTVTVRFSPTQEGPASGKLTFTTTQGVTYTVTLAGSGIGNTPPRIVVPPTPLKGTVGEPFTLRVTFTDPDTGDHHTAQVSWAGPPVDAEVISEPGGGTISAPARTFTEPVSGKALVLLWDDKHPTAVSALIDYVIEEAMPNAAPQVSAGPDAQVSVGEKLQRTVTFTDPDSTSWSATVDYGDGTGVRPVAVSGQSIALEHQWAAAGSYTVTVKVNDGGLEASGMFGVTVAPGQPQNKAPVVTLTGPATIAQGGTWVGKGSFTDPDSTSWTFTADYGDGTGPQPLALVAGQLKLEHVFTGSGEVTVTLAVTDNQGATGTASVKVQVTNAAPVVTLKEPVAVAKVGEPVLLAASFADPGTGDSHTATWTVGAEKVAGALSEHPGKGKGAGTGTVGLPYVFTEPGVYPVAVTVTDGGKAAATADTAGGRKAYVRVYDRAGAVAGAGMVASPAGSCLLEADCGKAGRASLTVTARYRGKKGGPEGELRYSAAGFTLTGTSYEVLVAVDGTATLRGTGTTGKAGKAGEAGKAGKMRVTFELTAVDSGTTVGRIDQLRLRAWDSTGRLVYDNQPTGAASPAVTGTLRVSG
ncbi:DUF11 domain-containing protein [Microtetraspora sp. AC03309]|uniref:PKD domain-containing protein n=1 Tax=Microtetraspora sp. AC03309 TaxID=2779376 RepID=UPI001E2A34EF|nr:PKD domain-containing protein [Microtetraspora sp. AC03309]MCC5578861.1 DUF11 domain-containing protein [Microtetraspora sp. AC03309]